MGSQADSSPEAARSRSRGRIRRRGSIAAAALVLLAAVLYAPSIRNEFIYDDHILIVQQPAPDSVSDLFRVFGERHWYNLPYYRPVPRFTMVFQKFLHGDRPAPYHLFNVGLIAAAALLVYALLRLPVFAVRPLPALLGAALFAAHPVASSCVYPICSGRETLIPAVFVLTSLYAFLRAGAAWRLLAVAAFALALLSKEQALVVPALFVVADASGLSAGAPGASLRHWAVRYAPVAAVLLLYAALRWQIFGGAAEIPVAVLERPWGPILSVIYTLQTILVPFVELRYEPRVEGWSSLWRQGACVLVLVPLVRVAWWHRRSVGSPVLFWVGWILLSVLPTANLLVQEAEFAERYGFLSLVGVVGVAATLASTQWERVALRRGLTAVGIALLVGWSAITVHRARYFRDDLAFHRQWLRTDPRAAQPHVSLGELFAARGRLGESVAHYRRALALRPDYAVAHLSLGVVLARQGRLREAQAHIESTLGIDPGDAQAHNDLGVVLARLGKRDRALAAYERALRIDPDFAEAHNNLGALLEGSGDLARAAEHYERALRILPGFAKAHRNLGALLGRRGEWSRAVSHYREALAREPGLVGAANDLAWILATSEEASLRDGQEAVQWAERCAGATHHRRPDVLATLAAAYAEAGRFREAVRWQTKAAELAPEGEKPRFLQRLELYRAGRPYRSAAG